MLSEWIIERLNDPTHLDFTVLLFKKNKKENLVSTGRPDCRGGINSYIFRSNDISQKTAAGKDEPVRLSACLNYTSKLIGVFYLNGQHLSGIYINQRWGKEHLNHFGKTCVRGFNIWIYQTGENRRPPRSPELPAEERKLSFFPPISSPERREQTPGDLSVVLQAGDSLEPHFLCLAHSLCFHGGFLPLPIHHRSPLLNLSGCQTDTLMSLILHSLIDKPFSTKMTNPNADFLY